MRKLILYSDQYLPDTAALDKRLMAMVGKERPRFGYIPSASDTERKYFIDRQAYYAHYGASLDVYFELDRDYQPERLDELLSCDAIHLSGGNTFHFLYWLQQRSLLQPLRDYVRMGGVLVGVSAGAIIMTPDIRTSLLCGDTPLDELVEYRGLRLVDFAFLPHYHEGEFSTSQIQTFSRQYGIPVYACPDGSGIAVQDTHIEFFGSMHVIGWG